MPISVREREKKMAHPTIKERYPQKDANNKKLTVCEFQATQAASLEEMVNPLPMKCDIGKKTNSHGISKVWRGYKLHMDVADGSFPISCILTSASSHDSQAGIPLSKKSSGRAKICYELMDSAYDVNAIKEYIQRENHVPLIKSHKRRGKRKEFVEQNDKAHATLHWRPADEVRFATRFSNERLFARLADSFLGPAIRVRGHLKVYCHIMLGVLSLFACELLRFRL